MKYIDITLFILSIFLIIYSIILNITFGFISFSKVILLLSFLVLIYCLIQFKVHHQLFNYLPKMIRTVLSILFISGFCLFITVEGIVIKGSLEKSKEEVSTVIVLGAGLKGDELTASLKYRLDACLEYVNLHPDVKIIVSGGQGEGEYLSEAKAMKDYLVENGIDENQIIEEDQSTSTYENFQFSKAYLKENEKVAIITNGFHMSRAKMIASSLGIKNCGYSAPSHKPTAINFYIREFFAYIKDYIKTVR